MPLQTPKWEVISDCLAALTAAEVAISHPEISRELAEAHAEDNTKQIVEEVFGSLSNVPSMPSDEQMITLLETVSKRVVRAIRKYTLKDIE